MPSLGIPYADVLDVGRVNGHPAQRITCPTCGLVITELVTDDHKPINGHADFPSYADHYQEVHT